MAVSAQLKEWNGTSLVPLTIRDAGTPGTILRKNYATNPRADTNLNGLIPTKLGSVNDLSINSGLGPDGQPGFARVTWTTAPTSSGSGINGSGSPSFAPVPADYAVGKPWSVSAWVRASRNINVSFGGYYRLGGTAVNSASSTTFSLVAGVWTLVTKTFIGIPSGVDNVYFYSYATGTGAAGWLAGDTYDACRFYISPDGGSIFDGSSPSTVDIGYGWTGPVGSSSSIETDLRGGSFTALIV